MKTITTDNLIEESTDFLTAFGPEEIYISGSGWNNQLPIPLNEWESHFSEFQQLNRLQNIYFVINHPSNSLAGTDYEELDPATGKMKTKHHGVKDSEIADGGTLRAVYVEFDGHTDRGEKQAPVSFDIEPHIRVQSSPGKEHIYWLLEPTVCTSETVAQWKAIEHHICHQYGADASAIKLRQFLRVPGFYNRKPDYLQQFGYSPLVQTLSDKSRTLPRYKLSDFVIDDDDRAFAAGSTSEKSDFSEPNGSHDSAWYIENDQFLKQMQESGALLSEHPTSGWNFPIKCPNADDPEQHTTPSNKYKVCSYKPARDADRPGMFSCLHGHCDLFGPGHFKEFVEELGLEPWKYPEVKSLQTAQKKSTLTGVCLADVQPKPYTWLCNEVIPLGMLTCIAGVPGSAKSGITLSFAAKVSTGRQWFDNYEYDHKPHNVFLFSNEDTVESTIVPRLLTYGADLSHIYHKKNVVVEESGKKKKHMWTVDDVAELEASLEETGDVKLVVIDPISAYMSGHDGNNGFEVREALNALQDLAERFNIAIVYVAHLNKTSASSAMNKISGSHAFPAQARAVYMAWEDESAPVDSFDRHIFTRIKANIMKGDFAIGYKVVSVQTAVGERAAVQWDKQVRTFNNALLTAPPAANESAKIADAKEFLKAALQDEPREIKSLASQAKVEDISTSTLHRARRELKIISFGPYGKRRWRLPENTAHEKLMQKLESENVLTRKY